MISDSEPLAVLVRKRLAGEPVELAFANGAASGVQHAEDDPFDAILIDGDLPDDAAVRVCRRLQADPQTQHIPLLLLSAASCSDLKQAALDAGVIDFLNKPIDPTELRARVRAALRLRFLADLVATRGQIDPLTGLWNRKYFEARLSEEISLARRSNRPVCCIVLRVENLAQVAETHGHATAGQLFAHVARVVADAVRNEDVLCRMSADELTLIVPNTPLGGALALSDRLRRWVISRTLRTHDRELSVIATTGTAQFNESDARSLYEIARQSVRHYPSTERVSGSMPAGEIVPSGTSKPTPTSANAVVTP